MHIAAHKPWRSTATPSPPKSSHGRSIARRRLPSRQTGGDVARWWDGTVQKPKEVTRGQPFVKDHNDVSNCFRAHSRSSLHLFVGVKAREEASDSREVADQGSAAADRSARAMTKDPRGPSGAPSDGGLSAATAP